MVLIHGLKNDFYFIFLYCGDLVYDEAVYLFAVLDYILYLFLYN